MRIFRQFSVVLIGLSVAAVARPQSLVDWIDANCDDCAAKMESQTGSYILERGDEALNGRAWLSKQAQSTIDVQYFIWSTDNVGVLAAQQLLSAAERGVRVRVLVDDTLIDADSETLLLLANHPNVHIRIYNPQLAVGVGVWQKVKNVFTDFRAVNQRMHDKTAIFDNVVGITGGRNMADEYFDFDHEYNFRDRDILLVGRAVNDMTENFEEFWQSELAVPVEQIVAEELRGISPKDIERYRSELHAYAADPNNFAPEVRAAVDAVGDQVGRVLGEIVWDDVEFISDIPGKNAGDMGLGGGGESTRALIAALSKAEDSILIQSPYLIMPEGGIEFFETLAQKGVSIRISTNSLASTDNVPAFSGYRKQRERLLRAGVEVYEFKPSPAIRDALQELYPDIADKDPVFALHAKSLVIDDETIYIGTFNLDPRSANLNTEVGVLVSNEELARQLTASIERDIHPENSWQTTLEFNPDGAVGRGKRFRAWFESLFPIEPVL